MYFYSRYIILKHMCDVEDDLMGKNPKIDKVCFFHIMATAYTKIDKVIF